MTPKGFERELKVFDPDLYLSLEPHKLYKDNETGKMVREDRYYIKRKRYVGAIRRDGAAAATFGTVTQRVIHEDVGGWDATADASGNTLRIRVTGAAATTINWTADVRICQVIVES